MKFCYLCGDKLNNQNKSVEHVVCNALGGRLKSNDLLCRNCNNETGFLENELIKKFMFFITSFEVERDRGNIPNFKATLENGKKVNIKPGFFIEKPVNCEIELDKFRISAPNLAKAKNHLLKMKRKYPNINVEDALSKAIESEEYLNEKLFFDLSLNDSALKAVIKMIVNYSLYCDIWGNKLSECINCIKTYKEGILRVYTGEDFYSNGNDVISSIAVIGCKDKKQIIGYLQLFSFYKFVILLDDKFSGLDFEKNYIFFSDGNKAEVISKANMLVRNIDFKNYSINLNQFEMHLRKVIDKIMVKHQNREIHRIIDKVFKDVEEKFPKEQYSYFTKEMINFIAYEIAKRYHKFLMHMRRP